MTLSEEITQQLERIREGWCGPAKGVAIAETIIREQSKVCVEIGVFAGKSLLSAAIGLKHLGDGVIYGIDSWDTGDSLVDVEQANRDWWSKNVDLEMIYQQFLNSLGQSEVTRFVRVLRMTSLEASKIVPSPIDLLHVDASHSEWSSTSDVCLWVPKVRSGGIVIMDDSDWSSTQTAVRFVEKWADKGDTIKGKESTSTFYRKR